MNWFSEYVGLPFVSGGRDRHGIDCWGLVRLIYQERLGISLPSYGEYEANQLRKIAREIGTTQNIEPWSSVEEPSAFDVVVMRAGSGFINAHVGVMVDHANVLHVERLSDACVEPISAPLIAPRISGFRRHIEANQ